MGRRSATIAHEETVLKELLKFPRTMKALSEDTGLGYYTVRRIVERLVERKELTVTSYIDRAAVYAYHDGNSKKDYMPRIIDIVNKASAKIISVTELAFNDKSKMMVATRNLPKYATLLLWYSMQAAEGQNVADQLNSLRIKMQKDALYAKNAANVYDQMLKEPRFWDIDSLKTFVKDENHDPQLIVNLMAEYERKGEL